MRYWLNKTKSETAVVMPLFAITLLPIIFLAGMVVDLTRVALINTELAYACDAAAIAAARYNANDINANATKFFYANYKQGNNGINVTPSVTVASNNSSITVSASANAPLLFSKLLGMSSLKVHGSSTVNLVLASSQIAMVLDVTGSMAQDGKIDGLRNAATQLVNTIFGNNSTLPSVAISIVPYIATVNVGPQHTSWVSNPSILNSFPNDDKWEGCVGAIDTGNTADKDDPPSSSRKWPVYFAESTLLPRVVGDNDWLVLLGLKVIVNFSSGANVGPNRSCAPQLVPLTNVKSTLINKINTFTLNNIRYGAGTFGNLGLVWGWNTISPKWKNLWDGPVQPIGDNTSTTKSIVIVTDGENNWTDSAGTPTGDPIAYAMSNNQISLFNSTRQNTLGVTSTSAARTKIDNRLIDLCTRIKNSGIQIFTVTFQVSDSKAKTIYKNCATKPEWAYQANSSQELYDYFSTIANQLKKITIVK